MRARLTRAAVVVITGGVLVAACGDDGTTTATLTSEPPAAVDDTASADIGDAVNRPVIDPGDGGQYSPVIDPAAFTAAIDNPFLPLAPGSRWTFRETSSDGEIEVITVEVLDEYRTVMGVETIVVHDIAANEDGEVLEDTFDWYAQDADGNVWYFGEDTTAYEDGQASTAGSWEAGQGGALPGIVMPGAPAVSEVGYRQEYLAGEAEDMGQVIALGAPVTVTAGAFTDTITTRDWTPLDPDVVEEKTYARGVGFVFESKSATDGSTSEVQLVEHTP
jgi:hypothetical protein